MDILLDAQPVQNAVPLWLLLGQKTGDNSQLRLLAQAVGLERKEIAMRYSPWELPTTLAARPSLMGITRESRTPIAPPWPNIVLSAGRRNEAAARWIRQRSQGHTKLVHLGRPWHHPRHFDLIISTPQYQIEPSANILCLDLPLHSTPSPPADTERFRDFPQPRIVLLIGGNSGALTLHAGLAQMLLSSATKLAGNLGGSLLVSTSARTPRSVCGLLSHLEVPNHAWRWGEPDNPYQAYLSAADAFIVTSDSISMLAEALSTSKPVLVFDLEERDWWLRPANYRLDALLHRIAMRVVPKRLRRDVGRIHRRLVDTNRIHWLKEQTLELPQSKVYTSEDLSRATESVRALISRSSTPH